MNTTTTSQNAAPTSSASPSVLRTYRSRYKAQPELDMETEHALVRAYQQDGDLDALTRLVESNLHVVLASVHTYAASHIADDDQLQEATIGLLQAIEKFDTSRGIRLATYARYWVRASVLKQLMTGYRIVRVGTTVNQRRLFFRLAKEKRALIADGLEPTHERLAERLEVTLNEVREMDLRLSSPAMRFDAPISHEDGARTLLDVFADTDAPDVEEHTANQQLLEHLRGELDALLPTLKPRQREILELRLLSDEPWSLAALGERFGVSRERARQIEVELLSTLRLRFARRIGDHTLLSH